MKFSVLFLVLSFIQSGCHAQVNDDDAFIYNKYDKRFVRDQKIDSVFVSFGLPDHKSCRFYAFDKAGNLTSSVTRDGNQQITSTSVLTYDINGRLTMRVDKEEMINDSTLYFYNEDGQPEKTLTWNMENDTLSVINTYHNKKLIRENRAEPTGRLITDYQYDAHDQIIEITVRSLQGNDTTGTVAIHKTFSYNSNGSKSREITTLFITDTSTYHYNSSGQLVFIQKSDDSEEYFYTPEGLLEKKVVTKSSFNKPTTFTELYRYVTHK